MRGVMASLLKPPRQAQPLAWLAVAALVVCCVGMGWRLLELTRVLEELGDRQARAEAAREAAQRAAVRVSPDQQRHWQLLDAEINFRWDDVFHVIEQAASDQIELLEMAPDKSRGTVVLRGEAREMAAALDYVRSLAAQARVKDAFVVRMQRLERGELATVEFEIRMVLM